MIGDKSLASNSSSTLPHLVGEEIAAAIQQNDGNRRESRSATSFSSKEGLLRDIRGKLLDLPIRASGTFASLIVERATDDRWVVNVGPHGHWTDLEGVVADLLGESSIVRALGLASFSSRSTGSSTAR